MSPGANKKRTTFAKLNREARLRERREEKRARKVARRAAADVAPDPEPDFDVTGDGASETESDSA